MAIKTIKTKKMSITEYEYKALITVLDMLPEIQADIGKSNSIMDCSTAEVIEMSELDRVIGILNIIEKAVEII